MKWTKTYITNQNNTSSTAQGSGGSFKDRKLIGVVCCCESWVAEQTHWWIERWLECRSIYLSIYLSVCLSVCLSICLSVCLPICLSICLPVYISICLSICLFICLSICLPASLKAKLFWGIPTFLILTTSKTKQSCETVPCAAPAPRHASLRRVWCAFFHILTSKCASHHNGLRFFNSSASRGWGVFGILTSKSALRHNGVQFFISHLTRWLCTRRFTKPTLRHSGATNHWKKHGDLRLSCLFLTLSFLWSSFFFSSRVWLFPPLLFLCP